MLAQKKKTAKMGKQKANKNCWPKNIKKTNGIVFFTKKINLKKKNCQREPTVANIGYSQGISVLSQSSCKHH